MKIKHIFDNTSNVFTFLLSGVIVWLLLILLAPLLKISDSNYLINISEYIYFIFEPVCHQIPERSILINSEPMAVCTRCFSVYFGGFLFILYVALKKKILYLHLNWVILLCLPVIMDFIFERIGIYTDIPLSRILTGLLLGLSISYLILYSILDFKNNYQTKWKFNHGKSEIN